MEKLIPILFSSEMVKAILEGRKKMTRRAVKWPQKCPTHKISIGDSRTGPIVSWCKYQPGNVLWVREGFCYDYAFNGTPDDEGKFYFYKADWQEKDVLVSGERWKPSIHMPYTACRIWLKITSIRIERLQDISEEDAVAEGIYSFNGPNPLGMGNREVTMYGDYLGITEFYSARESFASLWQSINGAESWAENPWVWVVSFERTNKPSSSPSPPCLSAAL